MSGSDERIVERLDKLVDATKENTHTIKEVNAPKPARFDFKWFLISVLIVGGIQGFADLYARVLTSGPDARDGVTYFVLVPFGYYIGPLIAAWRSPSRTILEPAVAAAVVAIFASYLRWHGEFPPIISGIFYFLVALSGAKTGEKIQSSQG